MPAYLLQMFLVLHHCLPISTFLLLVNILVLICYVSCCSIIPTDEDIAALPHFCRAQLTLTKFLGSGAFGEVFEGLAKNILGENSGETKCAPWSLSGTLA